MQAKSIFILMVKVNKLFSFPFVLKFSKIENMFFVFLSSYRNTHGRLEEFKKSCANTYLSACVLRTFLVLLNFHYRVTLYRNMVHIFYLKWLS